jgi:competence protein ComEA
MDSNAPWRALDTPVDESTQESAGRTGPSTLLLVLAVVALAIGSLAVVGYAELQSGGRVEVLANQTPLTGSAASPVGPMVVVQVAGAVVKPGVYSLPAGSRVADAVTAAGGYSPDVDPRAAETKLNLAAKLVDAQSIVVPRRGDATAGSSSGAGSGGSSTPAGVVNLNTATSAELDALPGIGPATAAKIIASREQSAFTSVNDLVSRKLVSATTLAKFKDQVTV